jgi:cbb3-type cytochrome oxidase maturation protein
MMTILLALIPISLLLLIAAIVAFFWAVGKGQFENLDAAALDILTDDSKPPSAATEDTRAD